MVSRVGLHETQGRLAGLLVSMGRKLALKTCAAVHAAVIRQEIIDRPLDGFQRRGGCGVIEIDIRPLPAPQQGDLDIVSDE